MDYRGLIERYREHITEVTPQEAAAAGYEVVLDVREPVERIEGSIDGSIAVPRSELERTVGAMVPDPGASVLVYCVVGESSVLAAHTLQTIGYRHVASLAGGFRAWRDSGLPWHIDDALSSEERMRYDRQLRLDAIGVEGQQRLLEAKVLVVGAGGLGSPAALYLAAAGVGTLGILDHDRVDVTNLHRQVLHDTPGVGRFKVASAADRLRALNPEIKVETHQVLLDEANAAAIVAGYDVVVDGTDNFPTRLALNDASIATGVPVVHGSALRFEGTVAVFDPPEGPCYRCLFPELPDEVLTCADAGVLGAMTGVIGATQAVEAIKLVVGAQPLSGELLVYDALGSRWSRFPFTKDPNCPACRKPPLRRS